MKTKDYTYKYKPVRILKKSAWEIAFCMMMGIPVRDAGKEELEGVIRGAMPASLESMQIWKLCDEKHSSDSPHMIPYKPSIKSDTQFSYAVIDVTFPSPGEKIEIDTVIWMCQTICDKYAKAKKKCSDSIKIGNASLKKEQIENLIRYFDENQECHKKLKEEKLTDGERKELNERRDKTLKSLRDILKSQISGYVKEQDKDSNLRSYIYRRGFKKGAASLYGKSSMMICSAGPGLD